VHGATFGTFNSYLGPKRPKMRKTRILIAAVAASLLFLAAPAAAQDVSVNAEAQATTGENVTIESVEIDDDGWVAVYSESVDGGPNFDGLVGSAEVEDGENDDVVVETPDLEENGFYYAVLHYEEESAGEFNYPEDSEVTVNDSTVQDDFYVAVGTQDILESYAEANQNRRALRERTDSLESQIDELEESANKLNDSQELDDVEDQIESLRDELESTRDNLDNVDSTIEETESLLEQAENQSTDDTDTGSEDGGSESENGNESDDGGDEQPEGLPGFTAVAALVAALTAAVVLTRRD
jgi:PGF-CTERM protein